MTSLLITREGGEGAHRRAHFRTLPPCGANSRVIFIKIHIKSHSSFCQEAISACWSPTSASCLVHVFPSSSLSQPFLGLRGLCAPSRVPWRATSHHMKKHFRARCTGMRSLEGAPDSAPPPPTPSAFHL